MTEIQWIDRIQLERRRDNFVMNLDVTGRDVLEKDWSRRYGSRADLEEEEV